MEEKLLAQFRYVLDPQGFGPSEWSISAAPLDRSYLFGDRFGVCRETLTESFIETLGKLKKANLNCPDLERLSRQAFLPSGAIAAY